MTEGEDADMLAIRSRVRLRQPLDRRGLLLVPSMFTWPKIGVVTVAPWQPAVLYPARGVGALWSDDPAPEPDVALCGLLGRTKAAYRTGLPARR